MRNIFSHIIHCSDTPNEREVAVEEIRQWHLDRGWSDIGYHYVIYRDGTVAPGRKVEAIGAHCRGYNASSIGTCLIGRDTFTDEQFKALNNLHSTFRNIFKHIEAFGHRDFDKKKTCPNFEVKEVIKV